MADEFFYNGAIYALDKDSDSIYSGSRLPAGAIGMPTSIQTANQITEVSNLLSTGTKAIEVSALNQDIFEMIPNQHLEELNRLSKLTNIDLSVHGPMIEPSGFTKEGWSEDERALAERQLANTVIRAHKINPDKPMPVTIHSSGLPGTEMMPISIIGEKNLTEEEKEKYGETGAIPTKMIAVNRETGQMRPMIREKTYSMMAPEGKIWAPEERLESVNNTQWSQQLSQLALYKKEADEILRRVEPQIPLINQVEKKIELNQPVTHEEMSTVNGVMMEMSKAKMFLEDVEMSFRNSFEQIAKYGDDESKKKLNQISEDWKKNRLLAQQHPEVFSKLLDNGLHNLKQMGAPQIYQPIEEFAKEKASKTFANVAFESYDKLGEKSPIISIENPPYGWAISTASDLKDLIKMSRKGLANKIVKEKGLPEEEAKRIAESMIGATWDTSHISMMRKQGFGKQELVKEAEKIAPYVKHVHLNDNLGSTHTDLPPGMGDVPISKIVKKLKEKGYEGKYVFEGGNWFQQYKTSPHGEVLKASDSPIYAAKAQPSWASSYGTTGSYSSGYGRFLPDTNFSTYGAGFEGLPLELGGQVAGKQSRFSGAPMD